jgi:hypothetical protein
MNLQGKALSAYYKGGFTKDVGKDRKKMHGKCFVRTLSYYLCSILKKLSESEALPIPIAKMRRLTCSMIKMSKIIYLVPGGLSNATYYSYVQRISKERKFCG